MVEQSAAPASTTTAIRSSARLGIWEASGVVFVSSLCTLVLELVAGRVLAPYVGVSLYTWTSIIGVVLAGITLGNYAGGQLADRFASRRVLGLLFLGGGLASLGVLVATPIMQTKPPIELSLVVRIILYTTLIFFLPSFILGMVSPVVIKLTLLDLGRTGNVVGRIYAFSTAGSIIGTFLTGFVLVTMFGTRGIIWAVAVTLFLMAVLVGRLWQNGFGRALAVGAVVAGYVVYSDRISYAAPCLRETNYFCIQIHDDSAGGRPMKALVLDHLIHSYTDLEDPTNITYSYEKIYAEFTRYATRNGMVPKTLFIGGGGYTFPRYIEHFYPDSEIDVIEIDPEVTAVNYEFLGLDPRTRIVTHNLDARVALNDWNDRSRFNLIFGDAFNDLSIPYHLTTREFSQQVASLLTDDGMYLANVIDKFKSGEFMRAYVRTLKQVFPHVYLVAPGEIWSGDSPSTFVVIGSKQPLDRAAFGHFAAEPGRSVTISAILDDDRLEDYIRSGQQIFLTDDYAPVDNLVAPLFIERGL